MPLSPHGRAALGAQRTREASDRLSAAPAGKRAQNAFCDVVRDRLWAAGVVDVWVGCAETGVAQVVALDRERTADQWSRYELRPDQEEEILDRAEAVLCDFYRVERGETRTGLSAVRCAGSPSQASLF